MCRSFTFASDPDQHVCEVQLVHAGMLTARKHCNAHAAYAKFRSALELLETFGLAPGSPEETQASGAVDTQHHEFVQTLEDGYKTLKDWYVDIRWNEFAAGTASSKELLEAEVEFTELANRRSEESSEEDDARTLRGTSPARGKRRPF